MSTANNVISALSSYGVKKVSANQYRSKSPYRGDSDSPSFALTITDDEHGTWFDFVSEQGGSLYELADYLGVDRPRHQVQSTHRAYSSPQDYAKAHGVSWEKLQQAGWQSCTHHNRPALKFRTKTGYRYRFLDDKQPRYINPNGYKPCWYGLNEKLASQLESGAPLVIANGEISTVAGKVNGLAVACVTSGEKDIPAELVAELKDFMKSLPRTPILVALDCDTKGQRVSLQIKETLENAGFASVRSLDLGLGDGGDLADFCMLHGTFPLSQRALIDCDDLKPKFEVKKIQRWEIIHASELKKLPPIEWLIKGEIPKRSLTVVYGGSGVGKSFWMLDKALRVSQTEPVVYMAGEGVSGYGSRVEAWCQHNKGGVGKLYMCLGAVSFMDEDDLQNFVAAIEAACKAPELVVIDTLARSMLGADENSTRDMSKFIAACEQVQAYFDCSVILVHHTGKYGSAERGSSALRGAAEAMIKLTDDDDVVLVENSKSKDSKPFSPYYVKLLPVDIGVHDDDGNAVMTPVCVRSEKIVRTEEDELTQYQYQVLEALCDVFEFGASPTELGAYLPDIVERTMYRVLNALRDFGFIEQNGRRAPYVATDKGLRKIGRQVAYTDHTDGHDVVTDKHVTDTDAVSNGVMTVRNDSIHGLHVEQSQLFNAPVKPKSHYEGGL